MGKGQVGRDGNHIVWGGAIKLPREKSNGTTLQSDQQTIASISMARYSERHTSDTYLHPRGKRQSPNGTYGHSIGGN